MCKGHVETCQGNVTDTLGICVGYVSDMLGTCSLLDMLGIFIRDR